MEDPHTRFRYSEATTVLGRLVEIWSGKTVRPVSGRAAVQAACDDRHRLLGPPRAAARLTRVYATTPSGLTPREIESVPFTERPTLIEGAVGLVSTVPDYLRFSQMLLNKGELDGARILKRRPSRRW
jgi:CubicO group peptidase (beta-lactamase class C family)